MRLDEAVEKWKDVSSMLRNRDDESNLGFYDDEQCQDEDRFQYLASRTLEVRVLPPTTLGKGGMARAV